MQRIKCSCISCRIELQPRYLADHQCKKKHTNTCEYCSRTFDTKNACAQHSVRCQHNPNRILVASNFATYNQEVKSGKITKRFRNQHHKKSVLGDSYTVATKKTRPRIGRKWQPWEREKHALTMSAIARANPTSYNSANRGRVKKINKHGTYFHGSWELAFYEACMRDSVSIVRCEETFDYIWEGRCRSYNPDFYLPGLHVYVEVKGYETSRDYAKWASVSNLVVLRAKEIADIQAGASVAKLLDTIRQTV